MLCDMYNKYLRPANYINKISTISKHVLIDSDLLKIFHLVEMLRNTETTGKM